MINPIFKSILTALLPYLTVMLSVCQLILSSINSVMTCSLNDNYAVSLNQTSPFLYNQVASSDMGSVSIALSSIMCVLSLVLSLYGENIKKQVKALTNDKNNLSEKLETLTVSNMWRHSESREPFNNSVDSVQPSPIDSIKTAYPSGVSIPEEKEEV